MACHDHELPYCPLMETRSHDKSLFLEKHVVGLDVLLNTALVITRDDTGNGKQLAHSRVCNYQNENIIHEISSNKFHLRKVN